MSKRVTFEIEVDVNQQELDRWVESTAGTSKEAPPYSVELVDWEPADILGAHEQEILDLSEARMVRVETVGS